MYTSTPYNSCNIQYLHKQLSITLSAYHKHRGFFKSCGTDPLQAVCTESMILTLQLQMKCIYNDMNYMCPFHSISVSY